MKEKLKIKIMAVLLSFVMLFSSVNIEILADQTEEEDTVHEVRMIEEDSGYGVIFVDENGNEIDVKDQLIPKVETASELPERYNSYEEMNMPSVKNQGSLGLCWAFAVIACAEASMIVQDLADAEEVDYSELHLAWFTNVGALPPETDPMEGDGKETDGNVVELGKKAYNTGASIYSSIPVLVRWSGVADEECAPYPLSPYPANSGDSENKGDQLAETLDELSEDLRYESVAHLQNVELYAPNDRKSIKEAIMEYGAVYCEYFSDGDYYEDVLLGDKTVCAYYCRKYPYSHINHSVTLVGWDDNFDKNNFTKNDAPEENGAWIVKNSWGEKWGTDGFFYMSYEEPSFSIAASLQMEDSSNYDNNYQYDGSAGTAYYSHSRTYAGANQFIAKGREMVKAVGFYTGQAGMSYTVSIFAGGKIRFILKNPK